ncbi:hypothetical protein F7725_005043 [Dissostichus mawsoni]|uniref:Uncharacterized protein n=1 Tax=Dissostichus mawsoni TaxID=36200 RepID=A0A7J5XM05_DISMA|nr:hypothetical protein F7725_005043 [Dissostichus mawsoni]
MVIFMTVWTARHEVRSPQGKDLYCAPPPPPILQYLRKAPPKSSLSWRSGRNKPFIIQARVEVNDGLHPLELLFEIVLIDDCDCGYVI